MRPVDRSPFSLDEGGGEACRISGAPATVLEESVANALADGRSAHLANVLLARRQAAADYEASVRRGPGEELRAGRMMIERASPEVLAAIAEALDVVVPPIASRWTDVAAQLSLPIIVGWDRRGGTEHRCVKLYVNASDASTTVRTRLAAMLATPYHDAWAVIGMNIRADGVVETKLYQQSADAVALAATLTEPARALAAAARAERADAGGVLSFDADASLIPRAFFIALREPRDHAEWRCVQALPGYDPSALEALLPFPPAPPRSVGMSLTDSTWTLYCKPRGSGRGPEALEPRAIFRCEEAEIGVFVEPTEHAARAFRRTDRHAISIRVRDGAPTPAALESLVDWFAERVRAAESTHLDLALRVNDPPAPWHVVQAVGRCRDSGADA